MDNVLSSPGPVRRPADDDDVAEKVLRRARVSKMARALQDRLALANIKIKHGWQHRSIDSLEPEIDRELKRKRDQAQLDLFSDTSSNMSGPFSNAVSASSPLSGPVFSDELPRSGSSHGSVKRFRMDPPVLPSAARLRPRTLTRSQSQRQAIAGSWKSSHQLPESSPSFRRTTRLAEAERASYSSETSTIVEDSPSGSEDDEEDIPVHSFQIEPLEAPSALASSPPRTPPPSLSRAANLRPNVFSSAALHDHDNDEDNDDDDSKHPGKEGADLLLYLASSPSPAMPLGRSDASIAPSTPPTKTTPLPSSMMHTPGTQMFWGAPNTPGTAGFNFADFVNVTPSPAQAPWNKTPGHVKTPKAKTPAAATRRRLNFDNLMPPPSHSPKFSTTPRSGRRLDGFGLELGGELHSSQ